MIKNKKELRKEMQEKLATLSKEERENISEDLQDELFSLKLWKDAQVIGIYLSFGTEWDTRRIIEKAWNSGKKVVIPKTIPETKGMEFYQINDYSDVEKGHMGIEEPKVEETQYISKENIDLLVVPGLIFSKNGYRIGFGGGYYDRFLTDFTHSTISMVWSEQLAEKLPTNKYDLPVEYILT
ncbi:MAG: 5-formyltetrahydrofolate cyclo-ligase, partial [Atopostipes sp.]|nr:5-formyltetrahydrofolate cyclo-ligase [Atopostipes sp.]